MRIAVFAAAAILGLAGTSSGQEPGAQFAPDPGNLKKAAEYSAAFYGISVLVMHDGQIVFEEYQNGGGIEMARELASGTMSFSGVVAAAAAQDGLLEFDEKVSGTITEWADDPQKAQVTVRQLLNLVSGVVTGGERGRVPSFKKAVQARFEAQPGVRFSYGAVPFQIFGELLRRKLALRNETLMDYMERRIFGPLGLKATGWRRDEDGNPHMPSGAMLTARDWAKFGELVRLGGQWEGSEVVARDRLEECFKGTDANPAYGLGWWLNREVDPRTRKRIPQLSRGMPDFWSLPFVPKDTVMALGAGKQQMYVIPSAKLVVVRQAKGTASSLAGDKSGFSEEIFLKLLFTGEGEWTPPSADAQVPSGKARRLIKALDMDGDGKLSVHEVPLRLKRHFDFFDKDRDGLLDGTELEKAFEWANTGGR